MNAQPFPPRTATSLERVAVDDAASALPTAALIRRLADCHHRPLEAALPHLDSLAYDVACVQPNSLNRAVHVHVDSLAADLITHVARAQHVVFPLIDAGDWRAEVPLRSLSYNHERMLALVDTLRVITDGYRVPPDASPSCAVLWRGLESIEGALRACLRLEAEVLFPRVAGFSRSETRTPWRKAWSRGTAPGTPSAWEEHVRTGACLVAALRSPHGPALSA